MRSEGDDPARRRGPHRELGKCPGVAQVEARVDVVERHVDRVLARRFADQYARRSDRQLPVPAGDEGLALQRGALATGHAGKPARPFRLRLPLSVAPWIAAAARDRSAPW